MEFLCGVCVFGEKLTPSVNNSLYVTCVLLLMELNLSICYVKWIFFNCVTQQYCRLLYTLECLGRKKDVGHLLRIIRVSVPTSFTQSSKSSLRLYGPLYELSVVCCYQSCYDADSGDRTKRLWFHLIKIIVVNAGEGTEAVKKVWSTARCLNRKVFSMC